MKRYLFLLLLAALFGLNACDKGELLPNKAPDTRISVSEINLTGQDRLRSEVTLHWYGTDQDGWVTGFEISMDGTNWDFVTVQDSTFSFELTLGSDTTDIDFYVRAIDDKELADPTPAYLKVPIRNSAPTARFDSVQAPPDTAFIALTLFLDVNDLDGPENLDSIFLKANNGNWYPLAPNTTIVTLLATDPTASSAGPAKVLLGATATAQTVNLDGFIPGGDNVFYLKVRDIAGSESDTDTSKTVFVTRKTSDLLVIDANGSTSPSPKSVILPALTTAYGNYDFMDLRVAGGVNVPRLWNPTFEQTLKTYDRVFWHGEGSDVALELLENAAGAIQSYLFGNGKMLFNASFPNTYDNTSVVQEFLPMDSISTNTNTVRLPTDSLLIPESAFAAQYDSLEMSVFVGRATPFYPKSTATVMYRGELFEGSGWIGPDVVCAKATNLSGNTNVVFLSVQLHQANGRPTAVEDFLREVLVNEFNW